jgi:hypothetical protein
MDHGKPPKGEPKPTDSEFARFWSEPAEDRQLEFDEK